MVLIFLAIIVGVGLLFFSQLSDEKKKQIKDSTIGKLRGSENGES